MMKKLIIGALVGISMFASTAFAGQFYNQNSGQWTIEGYTGDTNYCSASTFWDNGSYVTFYVTDNDIANVIVHNTEWNIGDPIGYFTGYRAEINFFGKYNPDSGTIDYELKDAQTVVFTNVNINFLEAWSKYDAMVIRMPGSIGQMTVGLSGTNIAVSLMGDCLNQLKRPSQNL